jgi:hypothetical protein
MFLTVSDKAIPKSTMVVAMIGSPKVEPHSPLRLFEVKMMPPQS